MSEWINLCGNDGKVKARLNRYTGELVIKDHGDHHRWNVLDLCRRVIEIKFVETTEKVTDFAS